VKHMLLAAVAASSFCSSTFAQEPIRLRCEISETTTYLRGHFSGDFIREMREAKIENINLDLTANTWVIEGDMPRPVDLVSVTDSEFVLRNISMNSAIAIFKINRTSGRYTYDSKHFSSSNNETKHVVGSGVCRKASTVRQF